MALSIEEKYDEVRQLITMGKEKGYLLYEEVNDMLPSEISSSDELDDIFSMFGSMGIEVVDSEQKFREAKDGEEGAELDLTPGTLDKTNDPVRMYLREMGTVPLLTREGEVAIAKRIERGQLLVLKTITRSPIVIKELIAIAEDLRNGARSIKEIVQFDDEELTEEKIENKTRQTLKILDKIASLYDLALKQAAKLERIPKAKKRSYLHGRYAISRTRVEMSQLARSIEFNPFERKRLIDKMRHTVERLQSLEREAGKLERRADVSKGDTAAEARRELRTRRTELKEISE